MRDAAARHLDLWLRPVLAVGLALVLGGIFAAATGYSPGEVIVSLIAGAFGGLPNLAYTLVVFIPLAVTGVGLAFAFQSGLFNIGAEGQYWMGAIAATIMGIRFASWPPVLHIAATLLAAVLAGMVYGAIPGLLKAYRGAHEVITTMMLSYAAVQFGHYLVEGGPLALSTSNPQSAQIAASATLPVLVPTTQLSAGIYIALLSVVLGAWLLYGTRLGLQMRMLGRNAKAARVAGVSVPLMTVLSLSVSGGFAGLAGGLQLLGVNLRLYDSFANQYGFTAIVVALLARNNPWAVLPSALLFAALDSGAQAMQMNANVPAQFSFIVQGLIVFFVAADRLVVYRQKRRGQGRAAAPPQAAVPASAEEVR